MKRPPRVAALLVVLAACRAGTVTTPGTEPLPAREVEPEVELSEGGIVLPEGLHPQDLATDAEPLFVLATPEPYGEGGDPPQETATLASLHPDGTVLWEVLLTDQPFQVAAGEETLWVAHYATGGLTRLDPGSGRVEATIVPELPFDIGSGADRRRFLPADLEVGFGSLWMSTFRGAVARIDAPTNAVETVIELRPKGPGHLAVGEGAVWVAEDVHGLTRIDPFTNQATTIGLEDLDHTAQLVAIDDHEGMVWVGGNRLARIADGSFLMEAGGYVSGDEYQVTAIDPDTFAVLGGVRFEEPLRWVGYLNGFFGLLDRSAVFHHLSARPPAVSDATVVAGARPGAIAQVGREAWLLDQTGRRLVPLRETGPAPSAELPFRVGDPQEPRPVPPEVARSPDWAELNPPPIPPRWPGVSAWTGSELVIWGGETIGGGGGAFRDGAAYDPAADIWRELPPSPLGAQSDPGWVWTGEELVVWGAGGRAAAWDPATNSWRDLGTTGLRGSFYQRAVWTGREIIDTLGGVAFDPSTGVSRPIADPPPAHERAQVVWTGSEVAFVTGEGRYDPAADTWRPMAQSELTPLSVDGVWAEGQLVAVDYSTQAAAWDPAADIWQPLSDLPLLSGECHVRVHQVAGTVVVDYCESRAVWDPATDTWVPVAGPTAAAPHHHPLMPAGEHLYAYGETGFYRFLPDLRRAWSEVRRLVVGLPVDLPAGWEAGPGEEVGISVTVASAEGDRCVLRAVEASAQVLLGRHLEEGSVVEVTPRAGGVPYESLYVAPGTIDDRHHLLWAPFSTLVIDVGCDSRRASEIVLEHVLWAWQ